MSAAAPLAAARQDPLRPEPGKLPWRTWRRQLLAVVRLELRKSFLGRRAVGLYLLALAPPLILALRALKPGGVSDPNDLGEATQIFAGIFQGFIVRLVIFLACVFIFGGLVRREVLDRSLHFYFLTPLRRELLALGKYMTGLLVAAVLFAGSTLASFAFAYLPYSGGSVERYLLHGPGLAQLGSYLLVTLLACGGYGAVFFAAAFFVRSPALPALAMFGWESIHFLLPPLLKQLSVIHYLQSLCPVPISEGPFALLSDAPSRWVAIGGLLALIVALLVVSAFRIRRMEIAYEGE
ncbi:MAG TPA: hypothetical protein VHR45_17930 [Thermoanaerobaculia bacterium]|nr:hypothetical protein [Thermoanaerobaculia bacterium]